MTEVIISGVATSILTLSSSPPRNQPRKTATTGFTKAWVATLLAGSTLISQRKDDYATREPKMIRYVRARTDFSEKEGIAW